MHVSVKLKSQVLRPSGLIASIGCSFVAMAYRCFKHHLEKIYTHGLRERNTNHKDKQIIFWSHHQDIPDAKEPCSLSLLYAKCCRGFLTIDKTQSYKKD